MEQGQIAEGNKSIAKFMGGFQRDRNGTQVWDHAEYTSPLAGGKYIFAYELQYHTSWDWLMVVVEKIGDILADSDGEAGYMETYSELAWGWEVKIWLQDILEPLVRIQSKQSFIDAYWQAVIQFIQWYNKIQKP